MTSAVTDAVLGIIGGSGIYDLPGLENVRDEVIASPWGEPSAVLTRAVPGGLPIVFLTRPAARRGGARPGAGLSLKACGMWKRPRRSRSLSPKATQLI